MKRVIVAMLTAVLVVGAQTKNEAERMFKVAQNAEVVDGDLQAAIEQYDTIASKFSKTDRAASADALVRMAECYTKLGDDKARKIYERVVREYSDQREAVAVARARLGGSESAVRAKGDRVVWAGENVNHVGGSISPDGRLISYTDWFWTGNLMLHDLASGTDRPLTGNKEWGGGNAGSSTFSRDGKQVAYSWNNWEARLAEIRIVNPEGTGVPHHRRVFANEEIRNIWLSDWSPNGKWLAVTLQRKDRSRQIALVNVLDGSLRVLKSVGWRPTGKIFFSPDSKYMAYDLPGSDTESQRDVFVIAVDGSREAPAVVHPAHDVVMGWSPDGGQLLFASDRTGSMGLWAQPIEDGKPHAAPALLKPDIGSPRSLGLSASGALHISKDSSTQALHIAAIDLDAGKLVDPPVVESYGSTRPDWSRDGKYLAYKSPAAIGDYKTVLSIRSVGSGEVRELPIALNFFMEPRWSPDARWLVAGGRDLKGARGIYRFDAETGAASVIAPGRNTSRVDVSPDGKKIYYGDPVEEGAYIERDLASGETREVFRTSAGERASNKELSPDGRYAATIIWEVAAKTSSVVLIPIAGGEPQELLRVSQPERLGSFGNMTWTPDSRAVIVVKIVAKTGTELLMRNLRKNEIRRSELWLVPVGDGEARKLDINIADWNLGGNYGFRLHPNGRQIGFFAGKQSQEVWALENFLPARNASE